VRGSSEAEYQHKKRECPFHFFATPKNLALVPQVSQDSTVDDDNGEEDFPTFRKTQ
jgi:hypothetical protein